MLDSTHMLTEDYSRSSALLNLPREVLDKIYEYAIGPHCRPNFDKSNLNNHPPWARSDRQALLATCRKTYVDIVDCATRFGSFLFVKLHALVLFTERVPHIAAKVRRMRLEFSANDSHDLVHAQQPLTNRTLVRKPILTGKSRRRAKFNAICQQMELVALWFSHADARFVPEDERYSVYLSAKNLLTYLPVRLAPYTQVMARPQGWHPVGCDPQADFFLSRDHAVEYFHKHQYYGKENEMPHAELVDENGAWNGR